MPIESETGDQSDLHNPAPVEVLVCSTCRRGEVDGDPDAVRPGTRLHEALTASELPGGVEVKSVKCLSNCSDGCTIIFRSEGRWTYVYGNVDPETQAEMVVEGVTKYAATTDGLVPWRERPEHFRKNCVARIPPVGAAL